jgi:hypothetical protein|nr:MAG TPA: SeqA protein N-terminal domain [Caudoviricetes sp.]
MTPLNEFVNELQSLAKSEGLPISEVKKRILSLADKMDRAGVPDLEKFSYKIIELIDELPIKISDLCYYFIALAKEDWLEVERFTKPLLEAKELKDIRELSANAGMKPSI